MEKFLVYFILTPLMVVDCAVLVFLVLIQLPKKEAGAGLAFGGSATDALFGAGSGTVLTKITKYAATTFFLLAIILSVMQVHLHRGATSDFENRLNNPGKPPAIAPPASASKPPASAPATATTPTGPLLTVTNAPSAPLGEATNLPALPTNSSVPPAAPK